MSVTLRLTGGPQRGVEHVFDRHEAVMVGRDPEARVSIPEDGFLSRNHFLIEVDPPRALLKDMGSRNGTLVNGQRVREIRLRDGDTITAGRSAFAVAVEATFQDIPRVVCRRCQRVEAPPEVVESVRPGDGDLSWICDECKTQALRFPVPPPGFWIERQIGGGGMGEVFLARREPDRAAAAIKMMIPTVAAGERARRYFLRELEVLRNLRHPNIVRFDDVFESDGQYQLVMEFVDGPNAKEWVEARLPEPLSVPTAIWLGVQLLAGLAHAHSKGYVHRDIKPSNLLVAGEAPWPTAKLSDFGLAKSFRDNAGFTGLTHQGDIGGSVGFISPDHIREFSDVREPADIYSSGATLYYLLTGKYPYLNFDPLRSNAYTMILEHPSVPLRAHRPDVPEALEKVIRKSLEKRQEDRWRTAAEMARALQRLLPQPPPTPLAI
jgi:serine/threonine-protein kinase